MSSKASKKSHDNPINDRINKILETENQVHALSYVPFFIGPVLMFLLARTNKQKLMHHIKYAFILMCIVMLITALVKSSVGNITMLIYLVVSSYFGFQAFKGNDVRVQFLENILDFIDNKFKK